jgi:hypothetical protein
MAANRIWSSIIQERVVSSSPRRAFLVPPLSHMIFPHGPNDQLSEIPRVDKLPQWLARPPDRKVGAGLLGQVALVDQSRDNMTILSERGDGRKACHSYRVAQ